VGRWLRRRRRSQTEDIAAGTLVFGFAGPFQPVGVELGILHREQRWILGRGASIAVTMGLSTVEIQKPDNAGGQQKDDEHGECFFCFMRPSGNGFEVQRDLNDIMDPRLAFSEARDKESTWKDCWSAANHSETNHALIIPTDGGVDGHFRHSAVRIFVSLKLDPRAEFHFSWQ